jgi:hypothetical protein
MTNSARYKLPEGTTVEGLLEEREHSVAFLVGNQGRTVFELPYSAIEKIVTPVARPTVLKIVAGGSELALKLTGAVIDGERHTEVGWQGSSSGEYDQTREEQAASDAAVLLPAVVKTVDYVAADRVRRARVCKRILARRDGGGDGSTA